MCREMRSSVEPSDRCCGRRIVQLKQATETTGDTHRADMRRAWDHFAHEDPHFYIATKANGSHGCFYDSGKNDVDRILGLIKTNGVRERMLEVGCGLGRMSREFALHFDVVEAVDISAEMVRKARLGDPPPNLRFTILSDDERSFPFPPNTFDLVVSYLVFQHVPNDAVIRWYLNEIRRMMKDKSQAVLHFDTRPERLIHSLYKTLPDRLLPRPHRRYIRRYRRDHRRLTHLIEQEIGLRIVKEYQPYSADNLFVVERIEQPRCEIVS